MPPFLSFSVQNRPPVQIGHRHGYLELSYRGRTYGIACMTFNLYKKGWYLVLGEPHHFLSGPAHSRSPWRRLIAVSSIILTAILLFITHDALS